MCGVGTKICIMVESASLIVANGISSFVNTDTLKVNVGSKESQTVQERSSIELKPAFLVINKTVNQSVVQAKHLCLNLMI